MFGFLCIVTFLHYWVTYWGGHPCSWFHWPFHFYRSSEKTSEKKTASSSLCPLGDDCSCAHAYPVVPQYDPGDPQWPWAVRRPQSQRCSVEPWEFVGWQASVCLCEDGRLHQVVRRRKPPVQSAEAKTGREAVAMNWSWSQNQDEPLTQPWSRTRHRQPYSLQQPIWSW